LNRKLLFKISEVIINQCAFAIPYDDYDVLIGLSYLENGAKTEDDVRVVLEKK
jgi:hypothetical protein